MASPSEVAGVVVDLALRRPPTLGDGRLVCIDGPAGSGKTTLAAEVAALVAEPTSCTWTTSTPGGPGSTTR